ncbi:MAG: hypothetical protein IKE58_08345 [Blautia sp.]|nr:hypothetical protein [Blautia sp.]
MYTQRQIQDLQDYFESRPVRPENTVYVTRITGYNSQIEAFLLQYFREAGKKGWIIDRKLPNPAPSQVEYYYELLGKEFQLSLGFLEQSVKRWLTNMDPAGRRDLSLAMYDSLFERRRQGENEERLKNSFIRYMCWMYYQCRSLMPRLGEERLPRLLHLGEVTLEELRFFHILSGVGCDIVLVLPDRGSSYRKTDPALIWSFEWKMGEQKEFPAGFDIAWLENQAEASEQKKRQEEARREAQAFYANTSAYEAERELDGVLYEGAGLYRPHQFRRAQTVFLKMTYEELFLLWDKRPLFREGFQEGEDEVRIPVLFAKVSGVAKGSPEEYFKSIGRLWTPETTLFRSLPLPTGRQDQSWNSRAAQLMKNLQLNRSRIRQQKEYIASFGVLREEMQEHILDKVQEILDKRLIRGIGSQGAEYTVLAVALNLDPQLLRQIQSFDFTGRNPKVIVISTEDKLFSLAEAVLLLLLGLIGFDIALFVPSGYQTAERYYTVVSFIDFQAGEYLYDLPVPDDEMLRAREEAVRKPKSALEWIAQRLSPRKP